MPCPDCKRKAEEVREMCAKTILMLRYDAHPDYQLLKEAAKAIRQLDLTVPSSTEEGPRRFTMEIDLDEKGGDAK